MKKIFLIGIKDVTLVFRDRMALMVMLLAPFLLTLGLGFVTGNFSGAKGSGLNPIAVILVNQDKGPLGAALVNEFESNELASLVNTTTLNDPVEARQQVDQQKAATVVIIPSGFSASTIPQGGQPTTGPLEQIELYSDPAQTTGAEVVRSILNQFLNQVEEQRIAGEVTTVQLLQHGLIQKQDAQNVISGLEARPANQTAGQPAITVNAVTAAGQPVKTNALSILAPGMALMFLMYTVTSGGRSLLAERAQGTLPRLLISPTSSTQVLAGKVFGTYLSGVAQMLILIVASTLFFNLDWGNPLGVAALVLAAVAGAVGWAMVITALAKTPAQVGNVGAAMMLIFGILGGGFINLSAMPGWLQIASKATPNVWGLNGFTSLAAGGNLSAIYQPVAALFSMGLVLFALAVVLFNRRGIAGK